MGREKELAQIWEALRRAESGVGSTLILKGPAGIGKTHLLARAVREARERRMHILLSTGSYGDFSPYRMWNMAFRIRELAYGEEESSPSIPPAAPYAFVGPEEAPPSSGTPTDPSDAGWQWPPVRSELPDEWLPVSHMTYRIRERLRAMSREHPVLVVLDDLHWADVSSLEVLMALSQDLRESPVLFLGAYIPEEAEANWKRRLRISERTLPEVIRFMDAEEIPVPPLTRAEALEFLKARSGSTFGERGELGDRIWEISQGNPYHIELLARDPRRVDLDGERKSAVALPPGGSPSRDPPFEAYLEESLATLSPEERDILTVAAVLGNPFDGRVVGQLFPEVPDMGAVLSSLRDKHSLIRSMTSPFWYFEHPTMHRAILKLTPPEVLVRAHQKVGGWMAEHVSDRPETIARHFLKAGAPAVSSPWLSEAWEAARNRGDGEAMVRIARWGRQLATPALEGSDGAYRWEFREALGWWSLGQPTEALSLLESARRGTPPGLASVQVLCALAEIRSELGELDTAERHLAEARQEPVEAESADLAGGLVGATQLLIWGKFHDYQRIRQEGPDLLDQLKSSAAPRDVLRIAHYLTYAYLSAGEFEMAERQIRETAEFAERFQQGTSQLQIQQDRAALELQRGHLREAERLLRPVVQAYRRSSSLPDLVVALGNLGEVLADMGRHVEAKGILQEGWQLGHMVGGLRLQHNTAALIALEEVEMGNAHAGLALAEELLEDPLVAKNREIWPLLQGIRGLALSILGHLEEVRASLPRFGTERAGQYRLPVAVLRGSMLTAVGDLAEAQATYLEALETARSSGRRLYEGVILMNLGNFHARNGEVERARQLYSEAERILRECGAIPRADMAAARRSALDAVGAG